jgi:hypothetical protein
VKGKLTFENREKYGLRPEKVRVARGRLAARAISSNAGDLLLDPLFEIRSKRSTSR